MNFNLDSNGWTVHVDNDITQLTKDELFEVCKLIVKNMVVVFKNQSLSPEKQIEICEVMGTVQKMDDLNRARDIMLIDGILRVTGQKNQYGEPGLFGHKAALDWHCNQASNENRKPLIWLYGASGTKGSRTSWINNIESYKALPDDIKEEIQDIMIFCGYESGKYSNSKFFKEHVNTKNPQKLVQKNKEGQLGMYFPFLQTFGFKDRSQEYFDHMMKLLTDHVLQEKFMYHHNWEDGDIVISEQWLSVHKRWEFENMENRILHRIAFDYSNVYKVNDVC